MRTPEGKLLDDVKTKIDTIVGRVQKLSMALAMVNGHKEAFRQLALMNSQLEAVRDMKGQAHQFGALVRTLGDRVEIIACVIAPDKEVLQRRLANFARWDADCDLEAGVKDATALKALRRVYDVTYVKALY